MPQPLVQSHQHTITASFSLEKTLESIESNCKTPNQVSSCSVVTHLKPQPMTGKSLSAAAPFPQGCFHRLICFPQGSTYHSSLIPVLPQPAKGWPWGWECSAARSNRPGRPEKFPTQLSLDRLQKLLQVTEMAMSFRSQARFIQTGKRKRETLLAGRKICTSFPVLGSYSTQKSRVCVFVQKAVIFKPSPHRGKSQPCLTDRKLSSNF